MVELSSHEDAEQGKVVEWCPLCGTHLAHDIDVVNKCPQCGFDLLLVVQGEPVFFQRKEASHVPRLAYSMLILQAILAGLFGSALIFLSNPFYLGLSIGLGLLHLMMIPILLILGSLLRIRKGFSALRIILIVLGIISLPLGACAITAAFSISPARRYCALCGKVITWSSSYTECPHCEASAHRHGQCRILRRHLITEFLGREPMKWEIDSICPCCSQPI